MTFAPDEVIVALDDAGVQYVLIGGLAVAAHGFPRATKDVDIVPSPDPANLRRLAAVLGELEAAIAGTGDFDPSEFPYDPFDPEDLAEAATSCSTRTTTCALARSSRASLAARCS